MRTKIHLPNISNLFHRSKKFTLPPPPPAKENDAECEEQNISKSAIYKGLFYAFMSGISYSLAAVVVKLMTNMDTGQLTVYRFISILVFSLPSAIKSQENLLGPRGFRFLLVLRAFFGATNVFLNFMAFRYLPLGEAAVIIFSVPVFVTLAARICLKEPCGYFQSVIVVLTVLGIILTTKVPEKLSSNSEPYTLEALYGMAASFASLLFSTLRFILIRKVRSVHISIIMFTNSWMSLIEVVALTLIIGTFTWQDCGLDGLYIIGFGLVSYIGQLFLTASLQCELAGPVSTVRSAIDIVLAFVWQITIFSEAADGLSISGAVLVGFSLVFVGVKKWASSLPPKSPQLKYIGWMAK